VNGWRSAVRATGMALYLAVAPSTVPPWRLDPSIRVVAELAVGEATPALRSQLLSGPRS